MKYDQPLLSYRESWHTPYLLPGTNVATIHKTIQSQRNMSFRIASTVVCLPVPPSQILRVRNYSITITPTSGRRQLPACWVPCAFSYLISTRTHSTLLSTRYIRSFDFVSIFHRTPLESRLGHVFSHGFLISSCCLRAWTNFVGLCPSWQTVS